MAGAPWQSLSCSSGDRTLSHHYSVCLLDCEVLRGDVCPLYPAPQVTRKREPGEPASGWWPWVTGGSWIWGPQRHSAVDGGEGEASGSRWCSGEPGCPPGGQQRQRDSWCRGSWEEAAGWLEPQKGGCLVSWCPGQCPGCSRHSAQFWGELGERGSREKQRGPQWASGSSQVEHEEAMVEPGIVRSLEGLRGPLDGCKVTQTTDPPAAVSPGLGKTQEVLGAPCGHSQVHPGCSSLDL
jgi:hypothetical protein